MSSSEGDDSNRGISPETPVRSLSRGYELLRDGYPDWLLLKRGDEWIEERFTGNWDKSGRSRTEPMLIASYGTGSRPELLTPADRPAVQSIGDSKRAHLAFVGLHFEPYQRSAQQRPVGVRWLSNSDDILFEDVYISGYATNFSFLDYKGSSTTDLRIRRSTVVDAWSATSHSQGIFARGVNGLLLEENVFDHNGWNEAVIGAEPTKFNHNLYIKNSTKDVIARGNIIARASATGMQARSGGLIENNLFLGNALGLNWGPAQEGTGGVGGRVEHNVFEGCVNRGYGAWGLAIGNIGSSFNAEVKNNLIARCSDTGGLGILLAGHNMEGIHGLNLTGNIVFENSLPLKVVGKPAVHLEDIVVADNLLQNYDDTRKELVRLRDMRLGTGAFQFSGNSYYSERPEDQWFKDADGVFGIDRWVTQAPEANAGSELIEFPDPDRSIESYSAMLGGEDSLKAFLLQARAQSKANWRKEYTAEAANGYIMDGFGLSAVDGGDTGADAEPGSDTDSDSGSGSNTDTGTGPNTDIGSTGTEFIESSDTRVIYVSNSEGHDANSGLTDTAPVRTLSKGYELLRDGYPDWLLLKRGDEWKGARLAGNWDKSGRSQAEPMLVSSYGSGPRPRILPLAGSAIRSIGGTGASHVAFVGLRFEPYQYDPDSWQHGVRWLGAGNDILFEDVYVAGFDKNVVFQHYKGGFPANIRIRRSVIVDAKSVKSSNSLYARGVNGLLIEQNVFDHSQLSRTGDEENSVSGHISVSRTNDLVVRGNIIARASATGLYARSGGVVKDNLFVSNFAALRWGLRHRESTGIGGRVEGNVILDCLDNAYGPQGIVVANVDDGIDAVITKNLVSGCEPKGAAGIVVAGTDGLGVHGLNLTGNVVTNVFRPLHILGAPGADLEDITISDNLLQNHTDSRRPLIRFRDGEVGHGSVRFSGNTYYSPRPQSEWFRDTWGQLSVDQWMSGAPETNAEPYLVQFPNPEMPIERYSAMVGGDGSLLSFLTEARAQSATNWRDEYTAKAANLYIMEGFGMSQP